MDHLIPQIKYPLSSRLHGKPYEAMIPSLKLSACLTIASKNLMKQYDSQNTLTGS